MRLETTRHVDRQTKRRTLPRSARTFKSVFGGTGRVIIAPPGLAVLFNGCVAGRPRAGRARSENFHRQEKENQKTEYNYHLDTDYERMHVYRREGGDKNPSD